MIEKIKKWSGSIVGTKNLREGREIVFADNVKRIIYPLTIRQLRSFMKAVKELQTETGNNSLSDEEINLMVTAASIALEKVDPDLAANAEALEDALDIKIFNELLQAAMGTDPNA